MLVVLDSWTDWLITQKAGRDGRVIVSQQELDLTRTAPFSVGNVKII